MYKKVYVLLMLLLLQDVTDVSESNERQFCANYTNALQDLNNARLNASTCLQNESSMLETTSHMNISSLTVNNEDVEFRPANQSRVKKFLTASYSIIMAIGVPGNILMIASLVQLHKNKKTQNLFMVNLAIGDLVNLLICIPILITALYVSWPYGEFVCTYICPLADVVIGNSVFTLLAITLERLRAVVYPGNGRIKKKQVIFISILMWTVAYALIGIPLMLALKVSEGYWTRYSCNPHWLSRSHMVSYHFGIFCVIFCIPFIVILVCFYRIHTKLRENVHFANGAMETSNAIKQSSKVNKVIKLLLVIMFCFVICFVPINILMIVQCFYAEINNWEHAGIVYQIVFILCLCHSIVNPIIMFTMTQDIREAMINQISMLCLCFVWVHNNIEIHRLGMYMPNARLAWNRQSEDNSRQETLHSVEEESQNEIQQMANVIVNQNKEEQEEHSLLPTDCEKFKWQLNSYSSNDDQICSSHESTI